MADLRPHPDAVLVIVSTGETMPYPTATWKKQFDSQVAEAKLVGFCEAVPITNCANGQPSLCSIEPQVGGLSGLTKVLNWQRKIGHGPETKYLKMNMLTSEWNKLSPEEKRGLMDVRKPASGTAAELAAAKAENERLQVQIAELQAAQAKTQAASSQQSKGK